MDHYSSNRTRDISIVVASVIAALLLLASASDARSAPVPHAAPVRIF